jgi:hypothetical protein
MVDRTRLADTVRSAESFRDRVVHEFPPMVLDQLIAAARAVVEAPEMRWCEIHGDWSPTWDGSDVPPSLCRWAHHVLNDSPDKPCRVVRVFLVPAEEETS